MVRFWRIAVEETLPAPTRADLLRENIQWREWNNALLDILADDDLESDGKLNAIVDLVSDDDEDEELVEDD